MRKTLMQRRFLTRFVLFWHQSRAKFARVSLPRLCFVALFFVAVLFWLFGSTKVDSNQLRHQGLENVALIRRKLTARSAAAATESGDFKDFDKRVFVGPYDFAFQPSTLCRSLRARGVDCTSADYEVHPFGDRVDFHFENSCDEACWDALWPTFDILHFHEVTPYQGKREMTQSTYWDKYLAAGKCVILQTHGTLFRDAQIYAAVNPHWSSVSNKDADAVDSSIVQAKYESARKLAAVVTGDLELATYSSVYSYVLPRMLNLTEFPFVGVSSDPNRVPLIVHAPSNMAIKGTSAIRAAIGKLRADGHQIEYKEVTKSTHEQTQRILRDADIVIDQLRIGWYGVLSVEAMALGKPVLAYIRPDLEVELGTQPPLASVTAESLVDTLRVFVSSVQLRLEYSRRARAYVESEHDAVRVSGRVLAMYQEVCR